MRHRLLHVYHLAWHFDCDFSCPFSPFSVAVGSWYKYMRLLYFSRIGTYSELERFLHKNSSQVGLNSPWYRVCAFGFIFFLKFWNEAPSCHFDYTNHNEMLGHNFVLIEKLFGLHVLPLNFPFWTEIQEFREFWKLNADCHQANSFTSSERR